MARGSTLAEIDNKRQVQMTGHGRGMIEAQNRVDTKQSEVHERAVTHQQSLEMVKILLLVSVCQQLLCLHRVLEVTNLLFLVQLHLLAEVKVTPLQPIDHRSRC